MRTSRLMRSAFVACVVAVGGAGCAALLGLDDVVYRGAGAPSEGGATDGQPPDGAPPDSPASEGSRPVLCDASGDAFLFAASQDTPIRVAVDDENVYWATQLQSGGGIYRCPVCGCPDSGPIALAPGTQDHPTDMALAGEEAVWGVLGKTQVVRCKKSGCAAGPSVIASQQPNLSAVAAAPGVVVWATSSGTTSSIFSCKTSDCGTDGGTFLTSEPDPITSIAVAQGFAYWIVRGTVRALRRCEIASCAPQTLSQHPSPVQFYPADGRPTLTVGDEVYFADEQGKQILRVPLTGGAAITTATADPSTPTGVTASGRVLYWVDRSPDGGGRVWSCSASDCAANAEVLAVSSLPPTAIANHASGVFWGAGVPNVSGASVIMKLPR